MMIMTQALMMVIFWNLLFFFFCTENTTFVVLLGYHCTGFCRYRQDNRCFFVAFSSD